MAGRDLLALLLDAGHLQLASARRGARARWQAALKPAIALGAAVTDPWLEHNVHKQPTELAVRWDYDAATDAWTSSETLIKMERTPFAKGAMRECLRMKKMSQVSGSFFFSMNWAHCNNYVAKRYMQAHDSDIYFDDIKMQMVAKDMASRYNQGGPPKAVDFLHAFVMEVQRDGKTEYFCVERLIAGEYVKHNNNSGALDFDGVHRATPHVFSRFSFYASSGKLMVVDIQGVGNLWTDPQIHSLAGDDYGDGNLGVGGMALFFSTSRYGPVAKSLGLPLFALSAAEQARIEAHQEQLAASDPASAEGAPYLAPTQVSDSSGRSPRPSFTSNPTAKAPRCTRCARRQQRATRRPCATWCCWTRSMLTAAARSNGPPYTSPRRRATWRW